MIRFEGKFLRLISEGSRITELKPRKNCNLSFEAVSKTMYIVEDILKITPRMRSILQYWIKQACRVELFKQSQSNQHALHIQMITSGLQIIYMQDEVAFIQTLVYYVERTYRMPD
ncbi:hypothetical protein GQX74_014430 [Glossina fuscipes]|nr:hypothetical protein GQX74_014430 [Glossina fuscipes]